MSTPALDSAQAASFRQRTFLGHPLGLYVLFFTEMWERFNYYGMRALLVLYMVKYYKWTPEYASKHYKWYTSLVYLTPLVGGFLADRYLGNKTAVIIGALMMAIGEFLLVLDPYFAFYAGLVFLIIGNGFFKPNMSTQVGRLYAANDGRRDGAYTIFYMGINLGAFLSPLICGWLADHTAWGYHAGFAAAGVGMLLSLLFYLFGLPLIVELPPDAHLPAVRSDGPKPGPISENITAGPPTASSLTTRPGSTAPTPAADTGPAIALEQPPTEAEAEKTPSVVGWLNRSMTPLLLGLGVLLACAGPLLAWKGVMDWDMAIGMEIAAVCSFITAWITAAVHNAVRDRVLAIYVLGLFVIFFWAAFEQAGNALNLWADQITNRYLTLPAPTPPIPPDQPAEVPGFIGVLNPVSAAWFQSINPLAIFVLAPLFAALWTFLANRGLNISVPTKMAFGLVCMSVAFALLVGSAYRENQPSEVSLDRLPAGVEKNEGQLRPAAEPGQSPGHPYMAGRISFDADQHRLHTRGVLPDTDRDAMVRDSAPQAFKDLIAVLQTFSSNLKSEPTAFEKELPRPIDINPARWLPDNKVRYDPSTRKLDVTAGLPVKVHLLQVPPGFDLAFAGFKKDEVTYDAGTKTLTVNTPLAEKDVKGLLVAAGEPSFRQAVYQLYQESAAHRISAAWLFWFYILGTIGELCLSPIGLSMVSKLAPARFATMLMGLWLLTSFFGNFIAGAFGEMQGRFVPADYFLIFVIALGAAAIILFLLVRKIIAMMHGIR